MRKARFNPATMHLAFPSRRLVIALTLVFLVNSAGLPDAAAAVIYPWEYDSYPRQKDRKSKSAATATASKKRVKPRRKLTGRYRATPQQKRIARERGLRYSKRMAARKKKSKKRYVAVRTLDPSREQLAQIHRRSGAGAGASSGYVKARPVATGRRASAQRASYQQPAVTDATAPEQWRCVMIWDTWSNQVVGNDCYAMTELPAVGSVVQFDTYAAEYVGTGD